MLEALHGVHTPRRPASTGGRPGSVEALSWLVQRWAFLGLMSCCGGALAYGASQFIRPTFVATTTLFVDSRGIQPLVVPQGQAPSGDNNAEVSLIESQAKIVTSQSVLSRAVASQGLAGDPDFNGTGRPSVVAQLKDLLGIAPDPSEAVDRRLAAIRALGDRVTVRRPERTFIMDISVRAEAAEMAARLANAVAQAYFDEQAAAHAAAARRASDALKSRLDELRDRVRQSEARVQAFKDEHGLVGTRLQLSSEQQLTEANAQLAQARIRRIQSLAQLDDLSRLQNGRTPAGDTPEAMASPTISLLRGKQADARRQLDSVLAQLGPKHPAVHDAKEQLAGIDQSVAQELKRIRQAAQLEYQRAAATEKASKGIVDRLSGEAGETSSALAQLTQLQQDVDIDKNLLNTFLSRSRETGEMEQVENSTARVVSNAEPPSRRTWPPRGIVFVVVGAFLGFWLAAACIILERTRVLSMLRRGFAPAGASGATRRGERREVARDESWQPPPL